MSRAASTARLVCAAACMCSAAAALAQAFPIVPPTLSQRAATAAQPMGVATATAPTAAAQANTVAPASAPAGACRARPSPDRQVLELVSGEPPLARAHVPLGEYRAQQVIHSPDGRWAVATTKLRGRAQFAAISIDLERCSQQRSMELPAAGMDAEFQGDEAVLRLDGGQQQRMALREGSVR